MYVAPEVPAVPAEGAASTSKRDPEQGKISSDSTDPIAANANGASSSNSSPKVPPPGSSEHADVQARLAAQKEEQSEEDEYGFAHPAVSRPQRTVWIPEDVAGKYEKEVRDCEEAGIDVSTRGAEMNEKGKVNITGAPPEERGWWEENREHDRDQKVDG
jgi:calcium permeable stress-gated cation channel